MVHFLDVAACESCCAQSNCIAGWLWSAAHCFRTVSDRFRSGLQPSLVHVALGKLSLKVHYAAGSHLHSWVLMECSALLPHHLRPVSLSLQPSRSSELSLMDHSPLHKWVACSTAQLGGMCTAVPCFCTTATAAATPEQFYSACKRR